MNKETQVCLICEGTGKIGWHKEITCHGCEGTGQVTIETEEEREVVEWK